MLRPLSSLRGYGDELQGILDEVLKGSMVWGHGEGGYNFDNNWLNTGSRVQRGLIVGWKLVGVIPEMWSQELGENFLKDFLEEISWKSYVCPLYAGRI